MVNKTFHYALQHEHEGVMAQGQRHRIRLEQREQEKSDLFGDVIGKEQLRSSLHITTGELDGRSGISRTLYII